MKIAKRSLKAIKYIERVNDILKLYINKDKLEAVTQYTSGEKVSINTMISEIELILTELSETRKVHDAKLWNKFKAKIGVGK